MTKKKANSKIITKDKHLLYEAAVQDPEHDVSILEKMYKDLRKKAPQSLREDFCGTHAVCCQWVKNNPKNTAIGFDLCEDTIAWGKKQHYSKLNTEQQSRVKIFNKNVLSDSDKVDLIAATNFSYFIFKERKLMLQYFKHCYRSLKKDGALMMDIFGGTACEEKNTERRTITNDKIKSFSYVWEQRNFNPLTYESEFFIHFKFPKGGPSIKEAFYYDWRLWTMPEIRDLLLEAGFKDVHVFWEGEDEDGDGNGEFDITTEEENCETYLAYIVGAK